MRISAPSTQTGIVVVAVVLMPMIGVALTVVTPWWGAAWMILAMTALVIFSARTFRGAQESTAPRPWWRMTATPLASALLFAAFLAQAAFSFFSTWSPPLEVPGNVAVFVLLVIGAAYANSAIRLSRTGIARRASQASAPR